MTEQQARNLRDDLSLAAENFVVAATAIKKGKLSKRGQATLRSLQKRADYLIDALVSLNDAENLEVVVAGDDYA